MSFTEFKLSGYAWNPKNLEIYTGDMVEWRWFFASYITGFTPRVVQVKDEVSTEELPGGFNSGAPAASGNFITVNVKGYNMQNQVDVFDWKYFVFFSINHFDTKTKTHKCGFISFS